MFTNPHFFSFPDLFILLSFIKTYFNIAQNYFVKVYTYLFELVKSFLIFFAIQIMRPLQCARPRIVSEGQIIISVTIFVISSHQRSSLRFFNNIQRSRAICSTRRASKKTRSSFENFSTIRCRSAHIIFP